jgi:hypothetical protein
MKNLGWRWITELTAALHFTFLYIENYKYVYIWKLELMFDNFWVVGICTNRNCALTYFVTILVFFWWIRPSGLFPFRINLKLWMLQIVNRSPWKGISLSQGCYLHRTTQTQKGCTHTYIHPCLKWDSNLRFQCCSMTGHFIP